MLRGGLEWWHIVIVLVVLVLLFGYRRLPSASKSIAQSLKIFRDETKGLRGGDDHDGSPASAGEHVAGNSASGAIPAPVTIPAPVAEPARPVVQQQPQVAPAPAPAQEQPPAAVAAPQSLAPKPTHR